MLPGFTQPEAARVPYPFDRHTTQPGYQQHSYGYGQRRAIELPRPLEPRPTLHYSVSESTGTQLHQHEAFRGPSNISPEYRPPGPSLPGLRDILISAPSASQSTYSAPWTPSTAAPAQYPSRDGFYSNATLHPPLTYPPPPPQPSEPSHAYQPPPERRLELPILATSPVSRHPSQSLPVSPYTGYADARDYAEARGDRARQSSTTSYLTNSVQSPYGTSHEDGQYRSGTASLDRQSIGPNSASSIEAQRKYLGVKDVVGEGAYHIYEGGFRLPAQVDGEPVNPAWGLTKANKPRKRLALACLDCREKKIKCEPGLASCLQCEKAKRPCRRAQTHQSQPDTAAVPTWPTETDHGPVRKGASDPTPQTSRDQEADPSSKRRSREDPSPPNVPSKKHRSASPVVGAEAPAAGPSTHVAPLAVEPPVYQKQKDLAWEEDPYAVDRDTTLHLVDLYFTHVSGGMSSLFPRDTFTHWVTRQSGKCQLELMALYALLAVGSVFADDTFSSFGKQCATVAKDAIAAKRGVFRLGVVHARLLMAEYDIAKGQNGTAWDYTGSAIRACTNGALRLHTEDGCRYKKPSSDSIRNEFDLSDNQLFECKRRTFWQCFLIDRLEHGTSCAIMLQDIFLQLPCDDTMYERGLPSDVSVPYFNNGIVDPTKAILTPASAISPMAWTCFLASIWGDVLTFLNRMVHRPTDAFKEAYEIFYEETYNRLSGWSSRLPDWLHYNEHNLRRSILDGYGGLYVTVHSLYHFMLMRLNRYIRHADMSPDLVKRNIRAARYNANALLAMMTTVLDVRQQIMPATPGSYRRDPLLTAPFAGRAIVAAIDIVGAGGQDCSIKATFDAMTAGRDCLRELTGCWNSAKAQLDKSSKRHYQIQNIVSRPYKASGGAWIGREWGVADPLEEEFDRTHDCIYATGDGYSRIFFEALKDDTQDIRSAPGSVRIV